MGFHRHLLADSPRTDSFLRAIRQNVAPGDVVVDVGTGTGIMAMAARQAGAAKVYAIERSQIINLAEQAAKANKLEDGIVFLRGDSARIDLPEKADVVVSECLGLMGLSPMMPAVSRLARKSLKNGGKIIPRTVSLFLAPVESSIHYEYVHIWQDRQFYGFDLSAFQAPASNNVYIAWFAPGSLVSPYQAVATVDLLTDDVSKARISTAFTTDRSCRLHGFCGWFSAELADGITLDTSPMSEPTIWKQVYLPIEKEVSLEKGSEIRVELVVDVGDPTRRIPGYFEWNTETRGPGKGHKTTIVKQSTLQSGPA